MMNIWRSRGVDGWLGHPSNDASTVSARYDRMLYAPLSGSVTPPTPPTTPAVTPPRPVSSNSAALTEQSHFTFNGGSATLSNGTYHFSATNARDAGLGIVLNASIGNHRTLTFDIRGTVTRRGSYARLAAQVYRSGDNDSTPSVSLDPIPNLSAGNWTTATIQLPTDVGDLAKVQFLLITDRGNVEVDIRNLRAE